MSLTALTSALPKVVFLPRLRYGKCTPWTRIANPFRSSGSGDRYARVADHTGPAVVRRTRSLFA